MKASDRYFVDGVTCVLDEATLPVDNLSVGGFFVASARVPMPGQVIELTLQLRNRAPFSIIGKVTWINDPAAPRTPGMPAGFGVKITRIEFPDKLAILDVIKRAGLPTARPNR